MNHSLKIGRIFGIDLEVHFSWVIVFVFFSYTLSKQFGQLEPGFSTLEYWAAGMITTILIFMSVLVHELSHSLTALREGISIRKITLFIFGGVAQMEHEPQSSNSELKIASAGPLASFILALIFGSVYYFLFLVSEGMVVLALGTLAIVNIMMAIFNLIPAFPLDGGRILRAIIWKVLKNLLHATRLAVSVGSMFAFLGMGLGFFFLLVLGRIEGLWYLFLGWLLHQAGHASYNQLLFHQAFAGVKISEIMSTEVKTVPPDISIENLVELFYRHRVSAFPVVYGSTLHGMVTLHQVKDIPQDKWPFKTAAYIMTPLKDCLVVSPRDDAAKIMTKMAVENLGRILVVENDRLTGILTRTDMMRFLKMHMILGTE